jgi:hypothetical protein
MKKETTMANELRRDGDKVQLPMGWALVFCATREGDGQDALQGFVNGPRGASASLAFALETGATSDDNERPIPPAVLKALEQYEEYQ